MPGFFAGYYNDEEATRERMRGGRYWSGDLAYRDDAGFVYLAGRTSDWLRVDGENLATAPIERLLLRHDAISQVAVYGVPDPLVGDQVMATVVLRDGADLGPLDLGRFLAEQPDLSPKAWPRYVRVAGALPSTATNKVLKRELRCPGDHDVGPALGARGSGGGLPGDERFIAVRQRLPGTGRDGLVRRLLFARGSSGSGRRGAPGARCPGDEHAGRCP